MWFRHFRPRFFPLSASRFHSARLFWRGPDAVDAWIVHVNRFVTGYVLYRAEVRAVLVPASKEQSMDLRND